MFDFGFFKQKSPSQRFLFILGLFMLLVYVALGVVILFFNELIPIDINFWPRIAFGVLLITYALIRFYRMIKTSENES